MIKKTIKKIGQSTLEYLIVFTAIVAAVLYASVRFIKPNVQNVYDKSGTKLTYMGNIFYNTAGSYAGPAVPTASAGTSTPGTTPGPSGACGTPPPCVDPCPTLWYDAQGQPFCQ